MSLLAPNVPQGHPIERVPEEIRYVLLSKYYRELVANLTTFKEAGGSLLELRDVTVDTMHAMGEETTSPVTTVHPLNRESRSVAASLRTFLSKELGEQESSESVEKFFLNNNVHFKIAIGQRIFATAGVNLEPLHVAGDLPPTLLEWLGDRFNVLPGDLVLHRHVHGQAMQNRLHSLGILHTSYTGWHYKDYALALDVAAELMVHNSAIRGIISEGSWIYDPSAHTLAPDGRPYLASRFLKHDNLTGARVHLPKEELGSFYDVQKMFASKNERRKGYIESEVWEPEVYGAFYPRDKLLTYLSFFNL